MNTEHYIILEVSHFTIITIIGLLFLHWVVDFLMQTDYMALNKSKDIKVLLMHCAVYATPFIWFGGMRYVLFLFVTHFLIDFYTSRITSYLWKKEKRYWFFVTIGFDQFLHYCALILGFFVYTL